MTSKSWVSVLISLGFCSAFVVVVGVGGASLLAACQDRRDIVAIGGGMVDGGVAVPVYCGEVPEAEFCRDTGLCVDELAAEVFARALCTCGGVVISGETEIDAFDSREGPYPGPDASMRYAADVGINGKLDVNAAMNISGSLTVAGSEGLTSAAAITVGERVQVGGRVRGANCELRATEVAVGGDIELAGLVVDGTVMLPEGAQLAVSGEQDIGLLARDAVSVVSPCPCAAGERVDIDGYVAQHRDDNDNGYMGLATDALDGFVDDTELVLSCGRFFLDGIASDRGTLTLRILGRVVLFVDRGLNLGRSLRIELGEGAELDMFVVGQWAVAGSVVVGDAARPGDLRLYLGGAGSISFSADSRIHGNVYAPGRDMALSADTEMFGAVFVNQLSNSDRLRIHYDVGGVRP